MEPMSVAENSAAVTLQNVFLSFGDRKVFQDLTCVFGERQISVLAGASGCGKSSLLRLVGGLLKPQSGEVRVAGRELTGTKDADLREIRTHVGMMFQNGALLSSMSIFENLALPLRETHVFSELEIHERVIRQLDSVGLAGAEELLPGQLSGGMVKRAALARALISDPEILLCDEPFSGLDPISVRRIEELLVGLNRDRGMTILLTSHHVPSTRRMADQVVFLIDAGAVIGAPQELMEHPDERIAGFWEELRSYVPDAPGGAMASDAAAPSVAVQGSAE